MDSIEELIFRKEKNKMSELVSDKKTERRSFDLTKCDFIKVFMMLAVILNHCIATWSQGGWFGAPAKSYFVLEYLCEWVGSFHTYVFTFISGYLFYFLKYERSRYNSFVGDTLGRAKRLLLPYAVTAVIWAIPFYCIFISTDLKTILSKFVLATGPSQLWFLIMLFVLFAMFYVFSDFLKKHNLIVGLAVSVAIYLIGKVGGMYIPNIFQIWTVLEYFFFYYMGFALRKSPYILSLLNRIPWFVYLIAHASVFTLYFCFTSKRTELIFDLMNIAIKPLISVLGVLAVIIGFGKLSYDSIKDTKIMKFLVKHNFTMYLFHQQLIYVSVALLLTRASMPVVVLCNIVISIAGSALISFAVSKIPVVKKSFGYK